MADTPAPSTTDPALPPPVVAPVELLAALRRQAEEVVNTWALVKVAKGQAGRQGEALAKSLDALSGIVDELCDAEDVRNAR